jgi:type II secretory ATPase GspE/PulE/Tfp pilus assembly ATPase PilB-like protein
MGLEPFNVSSALNLVLAQRLLRRICNKCKTQYEPDDLELEGQGQARHHARRPAVHRAGAGDAAARAPKDAAPFLANTSRSTPRVGDLPFFRGKGCDACKGTGSRVARVLYEVMFMTPALRKLILQNVGAAEIRDAAIEEGMLTLRMDGWLKVLKGITTLEQVIRETSAYERARPPQFTPVTDRHDRTRPTASPASPQVNLRVLLEEMIERGASDLHITAGERPKLRIDGDIRQRAEDVVLAAEGHAAAGLLGAHGEPEEALRDGGRARLLVRHPEPGALPRQLLQAARLRLDGDASDPVQHQDLRRPEAAAVIAKLPRSRAGWCW